MKTFRYGGLLALFAALFLLIPQAKAACTTADLPWNASPGALSVPTTLGVGNAIPGSVRTHRVNGTCDEADSGKPIVACHLGEGEEVPGMPGVYRSGIEGIGIELLNSAGQPVRGRAAHCDSRSTPLGYVSSDGSGTFNVSLTMQLIKTASTTGEQSTRIRNGIWSLRIYPDQQLGQLNAVRYGGRLALKATTCSVDPKSLVIKLGNFPVTLFTHVGSTSGWQSFNLTATCTDTVTMTARVTSANGSTSIGEGDDVLNLTPGSDSATGVGVRMLVGGVKLRYDYPIPFGDRTVPNQPFDLPFLVQYYQTSDQVTAGRANTIATLDIEYQ
ncbi:type 1 fimbrial protein [Leclercia adecarboxylata]|uniref:fimbrial protein n=1 Tax=Leclercia adecarboxylata TaxID=83655 RepID=UPI002DBB9042|nr:fimbrial protein [Leclercia adecarboxylata]MEB6379247.1 type 1 fimbrial protein [Leclercia adecarboxylata]